ncbi:MAG: pentapeptide repeat-containing protein [SAR324 cluster bacterium]|nr:pentapeptide repeat-containing protein [SAR324 cluster bacterium]
MKNVIFQCRFQFVSIFLLLCSCLSAPFLTFGFNPEHLDQLLETKKCAQCDLSGVTLENIDLKEADLPGANLKGSTLINVNLDRANLKGANLQNSELDHVDLREAILVEANLQHASVNKSSMDQSNFARANLDFVMLRKATLKRANFRGVTMRESELLGVSADEIDLRKADLTRSRLIGLDVNRGSLQSIKLNESKLLGVSFDRVNLTKSSLLSINIDGGTFDQAKLNFANMQYASLRIANFEQAQFVSTDLRNAKILSADFNRANLKGSLIENTFFDSVNFTGATWVDGSLNIPGNFLGEHSHPDVENLIRYWIEKNSREVLALLTLALPEDNAVIMPAILCIFLGLAPVIYFFRKRKNLLYHVGLMLVSIGVSFFLFTNIMIDLLTLGFLWEVFLVSSLCFIGGTFCGFLDSLFGGGTRKVVQLIWKIHGLVTIGIVVMTIVLQFQSEEVILPWFKIGGAGIMLLLFIIYLILPLITVIKGVFQGNPDSRIVGITFLIMGLCSATVPIFGTTWAFQLSVLGGFLFMASPLMIIFRNTIKVQNRLESYAHELEEQSQHLESKNQELSRLDKLKDEFLANTTHELKTPLNGMIGITDSMLNGVTGDLTDAQKRHLGMISTSSRRLSNLVNDLLDFSRLRHKHLDLRSQVVDLRAMGQLVLTLSSPLVKDKAVELSNDIPVDFPNVQADEDRLQQIFHNLVGNAIKFTPEGKITLSAKDKGEMIEVSVSDTGIGVAPDKIERIFESFEQADGSTAREYGGTGLGLAITRKLVELHGGTIRVESKEGQGSRFLFTLPVASRGSSSEASQLVSATVRDFEKEVPGAIFQMTPQKESVSGAIGPSENKNHEFHILAVDDDPINLQVLVDMLSLQRYKVSLASNGEKALALLENSHQFDLVLLDVMMPKMTGYDVCQRIREKIPAHHLPILLLTAKNQVSELVTGFNVGANDFLTKPISKNELLPRIRTHIQLSKINLAYSRFVPSEFLDLLKKDTIVDVELGDHVKQEMSILFSDIRSFTSLSETMSPEETFRFINSYLSLVEPIILSHGGVIDKYIGDAVMALFAHPHQAVDAGIAMLKNLDEYNENRRQAGYPPIKIGVGINTGDLMLGTIGGKNRMDGTVISDAVNLASRMEGLTKIYKTPLLISENTQTRLAQASAYKCRYIDHVRVKGKQEIVPVYEIFNSDPAPQCDAKFRIQEIYLDAIEAFQKKDWQSAAEHFETCLADLPDDRVLEIYLQRCREMPAS